MPETILNDSLNSKVLMILVGVVLFLGFYFLLDKVVAPKLRLHSRMAFYGLAFLAIPLVYFIAVMIVPMIQAFLFSFQKYNILSPEKPFIGFTNYKKMFATDIFWISLKNSFQFALYRVPLVLIFSLITALMFQTIKKGKNILRTFMLLPFMTSSVALGWIFNFIYSRQGPVYYILHSFGLPDTKAIVTLNVDTVLFAIAFVSAWASIGYYTLLFTVGLDSIPGEVYDAAKVDGANSWQIFSKITLPLLNPTLVLVGILAVTASLKNFDLIRVMSGNNGTGGPMNSTLTMPLYIYMEAFTRLNMGRAAAITVIFFFIILIITLIQLKVTQKNVEY
jgi:multiple sugar transport system permease protein